MTDNEIMKALKCCVQGYCRTCAVDDAVNLNCKDNLMKSALDLINRQKAEIERLSRPCFVLNYNPLSDKEMKKALKENPMTIVPVDNYTIKRIDEEGIRAEAINEFAERLKKTMITTHKTEDGYCKDETEDYYIDNLVKEMTEVQE